MTIDTGTLWIVIIGLGLGSFALRFFFLGVIGDRPLPRWVLRHLRYTAVAVLPGLVAPLVIWPAATGGSTDIPRLTAALVTLAVGITTKNVLLSIFCGAATLYAGIFLF
ncbi:Branched-chain amino acid transport protein [Salinihabitans flavidus]|uniref:Branched-chain amino acid transport protein n=1 Tax=Salinihabitans flavidus TaxID=569882 RepID=A0A1H8SXM9_9RHOB|nr:AzlD domain-containing protein [Salinihabitans flavidus]SEO83236.1 Branched-chain amino acid transport protein [Salinihabitans flavidus]